MAAEGPIASFPMDKVAAEEEIALLVRKPGFDELTPSDILRHMNNRFNINFDSFKMQIKRMVMEEIKKRNEENGSSDSSSEDENDSDSDSSDDEKRSKPEEKIATVDTVEEETKNNVKVNEVPKSNADTSDSDDGIVDDEPKKKRGRKSAAQLVGDMISNVKSSRRAAASNAIKQIRNTSAGGRFQSSKNKKPKDPNEDNSGRFGRMTKLCYISPELQQVTGDQYMKRCDVVKSLWDYIKENDLKDPKAKQFVLCNDVLESIFKKKRVKGFGMVKYLTRHIIGPSDMPADIRAESEREMEKRKAAWLARKRQREEAEMADDAAGDGPSTKKSKEEVEDDDDDDNDDNEEGQSSDSD
ncbi:unnamed protein product [Caenorhabditis sp. 36 PRJEB53466]|nr:unnamed protein product [Caenorhabditis sp. 36 PRJEB53466]